MGLGGSPAGVLLGGRRRTCTRLWCRLRGCPVSARRTRMAWKSGSVPLRAGCPTCWRSGCADGATRGSRLTGRLRLRPVSSLPHRVVLRRSHRDGFDLEHLIRPAEHGDTEQRAGCVVITEGRADDVPCHDQGVPVVSGKLWSDRGAAGGSPEPAMGLGWELIPVGQGRPGAPAATAGRKVARLGSGAGVDRLVFCACGGQPLVEPDGLYPSVRARY